MDKVDVFVVISLFFVVGIPVLLFALIGAIASRKGRSFYWWSLSPILISAGITFLIVEAYAHRHSIAGLSD